MSVVHLAVHVRIHEWIKPEWYVVDLPCGLRAWTSVAKKIASRDRFPYHYREYKDVHVLRPGELSPSYKKVTCLGCLVADKERP